MRIRSRLLRQPTFVLLGLAFLAAVPAPAAENTAEAAATACEERLKKDVFYLASDELEGRGPATKGIEKAADYIAGAFKKAGLKPGGVDGTLFPAVPLSRQHPRRAGPPEPQGAEGPGNRAEAGRSVQPDGPGPRRQADRRPVVFAGYGITSAEAKYDDYDGIDATDKVVVVLRDAPHPANEEVAGRLKASAPLSRKIANAEKHKAAAVLFVNDADTAKTGDDLLDFNFTAVRPPDCNLPAFHVQSLRAANHAHGRGRRRSGGHRARHRPRRQAAQPRPERLDGQPGGQGAQRQLTLKNVIGELDGAGPLAKETVVVGAHYDHLGYGGAGGSRLGMMKKPQIHHGADDNGSGSTVVMELARRFAAMPDRQGRRLVFMTFSGEELGLEGSKWYCDHPLFPLEDTTAMFNLDMVGRLRPDDKTNKDNVLVEGAASGKGFKESARNGQQEVRLRAERESGFAAGQQRPLLFLQEEGPRHLLLDRLPRGLPQADGHGGQDQRGRDAQDRRPEH